jgi:hypothetical protein
MTIKIDPRWTELQSRGYNLRDVDGDVAVALYYKEAFINDYTQTKVDMGEIITDAQEHWQEIMQNVDGLRHCRNCAHWHYTAEFRGNCWLCHWDKDKYSQDATPDSMGCKEYADRCVASAKEE